MGKLELIFEGLEYGGERGIRTPGTFSQGDRQYNGFSHRDMQDRRLPLWGIKPLCHLSAQVILFSFRNL